MGSPPVYGVADWGPLVVSTDVDQAIIGVLQEWLPTYLQQTSTERALGYQLALPRSYTNYIDLDELMDNQLPAIVVTTAKAEKTVGGPSRVYLATWKVTVSAVVRGTRPPATKATAALFEGAIRRCMVQKARTNNGPLNDTTWMGSEIAPVRDTSGNGRYLAAGMGTYNVATDAAVQGFGGPDVPNATSYVPLATVTEVDISIDGEVEDED